MAATTSTRPNNMATTRPQQRGIGNQNQTQTQTITPTQTRIQPVLHLRGEEGTRSSSTRRIQWADDVVDNEGLGRKKSKVCCIYHAPRPIDESSDESSSNSDDSSDSDSELDNSSARPVGGGGKKGAGGAGGGKGEGCGHGHGKGKGKGKKGARSPNAYEKVPGPSKGKGGVKEG